MMRRFVVLLPAAFAMSGCLTIGMYRTAHVLPEGEGDFGLNFSVVRASVEEPSGSNLGTTTVTYPNVIPEISYHYGVSENAEVGGRIALGSGMIELDTKYRLLQSDGLDLAVQPAVGYRSLGFIEGFQGSLPVILTHDLNPRVSLNASVFGAYTHYKLTDDFSSSDLDVAGNTVSVGGALGVQFRTRGSFYFMPGVEVQRSVHRSGDFIGEIPQVTYVIFGIMMGWGADQRIRKMDQQMDRIEDKLDRATSPRPPMPPPAPQRNE
jgi:hypothetical protein